MKKVFVVQLLTLFTLISYGQTAIDMLVMEKINNYRVENGVTPLIFDSLAWKASNHHSIYLAENGFPFDYICTSGHLELELVKPSDRLRYVGAVLTECAAENVNAFLIWDDDYDVIAQHVFNLWVESTEHNSLLLHPQPVFGAVSVYTTKGEAFSTLNVYK